MPSERSNSAMRTATTKAPSTQELNDLVFAFPALLSAIMITAICGPGAINAIIAIGIFNIPVFARVGRAGALSIWPREYILAARAAGKSKTQITVEHIVPNIANQVTEYHHIIIAADGTRVAALLSGEVDILHTVPVQDVERLRRTASVRLLTGLENRTVLLGFDHERETLEGNVPNPLRDRRVRQAIAQAIDVEAIVSRALRGQGAVTGAMWTRFVAGWSDEMEARPTFDRAAARRLLAEAGYPEGFATRLDCAVGAYAPACEAIAAALAQVGIRVALQVVPAAQYSLRLTRRETAMHMLAWGVPTFDALYTLRAVMASRDLGAGGTWNVGGYANATLDALVRRIEVEPDAERRRALIREAHAAHAADVGHLPLYHMMLNWAVRTNVAVTLRADNLVDLRAVTVD